MKKLIFLFSLLMFGFSSVSCKNEAKAEKEIQMEDSLDAIIVNASSNKKKEIEDEEVTKEVEIEKHVKKKKEVAKKDKKEEVAKENKKDSEPKYGKDGGNMNIPGTSLSTNNGMAKKYIYDYEKYVVRYRKAVEAKDMDSFLRLSDASSALSKQYTRLMSILPGEEIEKLSRYMNVKSRQLDLLSSQM